MTRKPAPALLSVPQAAERLGVSKMQAYRYIKLGWLACVRYPSTGTSDGGHYKVEETAVEEFIARHRQQATA